MTDQNKFNSQLEVTQTVTLGGTLNVTGTATFNEQVAIVATNDTVSIVATGVSITGTTTITGGVGINGATTITGTVTITGGNVNINGELNITGTTTVTNGIACGSALIGYNSGRISDVLTKVQQIYFGSIAGNAVATFDVVVSGALLSSFNAVLIDTPDILADSFIVQGVVTSDDTVSLKMHNTSNGTTEAITATYNIVIFQFS